MGAIGRRGEQINITNDDVELSTWGRQKTIWSVCKFPERHITRDVWE